MIIQEPTLLPGTGAPISGTESHPVPLIDTEIAGPLADGRGSAGRIAGGNVLIELAEARGAVTANVVFFHGLGGDPYKTWTSTPSSPPEERLWPRWLASDIEGLSVWTVGYEAPVSDWRGSSMDLADRAEKIKCKERHSLPVVDE